MGLFKVYQARMQRNTVTGNPEYKDPTVVHVRTDALIGVSDISDNNICVFVNGVELVEHYPSLPTAQERHKELMEILEIGLDNEGVEKRKRTFEKHRVELTKDPSLNFPGVPL